VRRSLTIPTLAWALAATVARTARLPNDFAEAHWLLDYRYGFIRRGLLGSVLGLAIRAGIVPPTAAVIDTLAVIVFATLCAVLLAITARTLDRTGHRPDVFVALAAVLTSPFVVTAAHLMGYMDHVVMLLTFGAVWLVMRDRFLPAGVAGGAATLVHESFVLVGLPLVAFAALARSGTSRRGWWNTTVAIAPAAAAFMAIVYAEIYVIDHGLLRQQLVRRLSRFPFIAGDMNLLVPEWLTTTIVQNFHDEAHAFIYRLIDPVFLRPILPAAVAIWLAASLEQESRHRALWGALAAAAMGAPLLLHLAAWDTARIWSYPAMAGFGCLWVTAEGREEPARRASGWLTAIACVAVAVNVFSRYPLLDYQTERFSNLERLLLYAPLFGMSLVALRQQARPS